MSKFNQLILKAGIMIATILLATIPYTVLSQTSVKMQKEDGVFYVPCSVNGLPLRFIFDTGAGDVSISLSEAIFMLKNGYLKDADLFGTEQYQIANGDIAEGTKINIRELKIGDRVLYNVEASIVHSLSAPILLGQSALGRFGSFSIDNNSNTLILNGSSSSTSTSTSSNTNVGGNYNTSTKLPSYVPTYGLIGYWPFNGNTKDISGNGHDAVNFGATLTTDRNNAKNSAYLFKFNYMIVENSRELNFQSITINGWFLNKDMKSFGLVNKHQWGSFYSSSFATYWENYLGCGPTWYITSSKAQPKSIWDSEMCDTTKWHMLTATFNQGVMKMYIDGVLFKSGVQSDIRSTNIPIVFGGGGGGNVEAGSNTANAKIDDIAIWNRALSQEEIWKLFKGL